MSDNRDTTPNKMTPEEVSPWSLIERIRKLEAENAKLLAFVEDMPCECEDEYGTPFPNRCERCNLLAQVKDGGG